MDGGPMTDSEPLDNEGGAHSAVALQVMEALRSGGGIASLRPLLEETSSLSNFWSFSTTLSTAQPSTPTWTSS